jgi:hypothetical protein
MPPRSGVPATGGIGASDAGSLAKGTSVHGVATERGPVTAAGGGAAAASGSPQPDRPADPSLGNIEGLGADTSVAPTGRGAGTAGSDGAPGTIRGYDSYIGRKPGPPGGLGGKRGGGPTEV